MKKIKKILPMFIFTIIFSFVFISIPDIRALNINGDNVMNGMESTEKLLFSGNIGGTYNFFSAGNNSRKKVYENNVEKSRPWKTDFSPNWGAINPGVLAITGDVNGLGILDQSGAVVSITPGSNVEKAYLNLTWSMAKAGFSPTGGVHLTSVVVGPRGNYIVIRDSNEFGSEIAAGEEPFAVYDITDFVKEEGGGNYYVSFVFYGGGSGENHDKLFYTDDLANATPSWTIIGIESTTNNNNCRATHTCKYQTVQFQYFEKHTGGRWSRDYYKGDENGESSLPMDQTAIESRACNSDFMTCTSLTVSIDPAYSASGNIKIVGDIGYGSKDEYDMAYINTLENGQIRLGSGTSYFGDRPWYDFANGSIEAHRLDGEPTYERDLFMNTSISIPGTITGFTKTSGPPITHTGTKWGGADLLLTLGLVSDINPPGKITVEKVDSKSNRRLQGAVFSLYENDCNTKINANGLNQPVENISTGNDGLASWTNLDYGEYCVKELSAPTGYGINNNSFRVVLNPPSVNTAQVTITVGDEPTGGITITKRDAANNKLLSGVQFKLYNSDGTTEASYYTGAAVGIITTDQNGTVTISGLRAGTYHLKEYATVPGYELNTNDIVINVVGGKNTPKDVSNIPFGEILIKKVDLKNPTTVLAGAKFLLYTDAACTNRAVLGESTTLVPEVTTGADGTAKITGIKNGTYYLKETKAAEGHELKTEAVKVVVNSLTSTPTTEITNIPFGEILIKKVDSKNPTTVLAGAKFLLYTDAACTNRAVLGESTTLVPEVTTGADGTVKITGIKNGTYYLKETVAAAGHELKTDAVKVVVNSLAPTPTTEIADIPFGKINIIKVDKEEPTKKLAGASFLLYNKDCKTRAKIGETSTDVGELTVGSSGELLGIKLQENIKQGDYCLSETKYPTGYKIGINKNIPVKVTPGDTTNVTVENIPLGNIVITKIDEETKQLLGNVEFELYDKDGKKVTKDAYDKDIGTIKTDNLGYAIIKDLYYGTYYLKETKNPLGYEVISEAIEVVINHIGDTKITIENTPIEVKISKKTFTLDKNDSEPLQGATIIVRDVNNDKIFKEYITTTDEFNLRFVPGDYILEEVIAPDEYMVNEGQVAIHIDQKGLITLTAEEDSLYETGEKSLIIYNEPLYLLISKKDINSGENLEGSHIEIYDVEGNILEDRLTGEEAKFDTTQDEEFQKLYVHSGEYVLKETVAPEGISKICQEKVEQYLRDGAKVEDTDCNYKVLDDPLSFKVDVKGNAKDLTDDNKYYYLEANRIVVYNGVVPVVVPDTGLFVNLGIIAAGLGIVATGYVILRKKKS